MTKTRTCATCTSFNPDGRECLNAVSMLDAFGAARELRQGDVCNDHQTEAEDKAWDRAAIKFWQTLGLTPTLRLGGDDI